MWGYKGLSHWITELNEIDATKIKDVILKCKDYYAYSMDSDEASEGFGVLDKELKKRFGLATSAIIQAEFLSTVDDCNKIKNEETANEYFAMLNQIVSPTVKEFILKDTGYADFGFDDFGQFLFTAYGNFSNSIVTLKYVFASLLNDNRYNDSNFDSQKGYDLISSLCSGYFPRCFF